MGRTFILVMILLPIIVNTSCKRTDTERELDFLTYTIEKLDLENGTEWVVILPGLGCKGCIQEAEAFMKDNVDNERVLFVLTKIESLKILQKKIGVGIKEHSNILIDRKNEFNVPTDNSIYPCIVELENGKVKAHGFQSPRNGQAFEKLRSGLLSER